MSLLRTFEETFELKLKWDKSSITGANVGAMDVSPFALLLGVAFRGGL